MERATEEYCRQEATHTHVPRSKGTDTCETPKLSEAIGHCIGELEDRFGVWLDIKSR